MDHFLPDVRLGVVVITGCGRNYNNDMDMKLGAFDKYALTTRDFPGSSCKQGTPTVDQ